MQGQVHQPHHFYLAWAASLLAVGRKTGRENLDHTYWIEGHEDRTVFHASNGGAYIRTTVPTEQPGAEGEWRLMVFDPDHLVKDIAAKSKSRNPQQQDFDEVSAQVLITPADSDTAVRFDLAASYSVGQFSATLPVLDLEWPYEIIATYDRHETDPTAEMAWPPASAAFINGVGKLVGRSIPARLNNLTTVFDLTHPDVPEVRIQGACATKAV